MILCCFKLGCKDQYSNTGIIPITSYGLHSGSFFMRVIELYVTSVNSKQYKHRFEEIINWMLTNKAYLKMIGVMFTNKLMLKNHTIDDHLVQLFGKLVVLGVKPNGAECLSPEQNEYFKQRRVDVLRNKAIKDRYDEDINALNSPFDGFLPVASIVAEYALLFDTIE